MTRRPTLVATAALACLSLAACSKKTGEAETPAQATAEPAAATTVAASSTITPGYWETTKVAAGEESETDHDCITAEDSDLRGQLQKSLNTETCTLSKQVVGGGRIDIEANCRAQEGGVGASTTKLTGSYTPTTFNYEMSMALTVNGKPVAQSWKVAGKRVADACPADDAE